jgi:ATP-binding cassette subfamily B multidrug efflux pump
MIKLLRFLKPYRFQVALVLVLVLLQSLANLYLPTLMADIVDTGIVRGDTEYIISIGGIMLLITIIGIVFAVIASFFAARIATGFGQIVRGKIFTQVQRFSLHEFDTVSTASLITRTTNDTTQVQQVVIIMLSMMVRAPMMAIGGIFLAISVNATLSWTLALIIPIVAVFFLVVSRQAIPLFKSMQGKIDRLNLVLDERLTGVRVIRAFDKLDHEKERFEEANLDFTNTAIRVNRIVAILMPGMMLVMNFTTIAIVGFGAILISNGELQVGSLMAFIQYATQILFAIMMVTIMFVMLPRAAASADRINEVLAINPEINDAEKVKRANKKRGHLEFRNVTFSYAGAEEPAVSNITFRARPGQTTAIIGGTGSGKSTLVNLIPRFYDVDSGEVLIDGVDVREMAQADLRAKIGYVPQKAVLFSATVAANIRYGNPQASDEEIRQAAETAQANEFISEMKDGFSSEIAQGGTNVSGGQKQRLAIARALVRRPEIYVFDDSFSALDFTTDAKLRAALRQETRDATVIIVAQRVGTVMDADQILVLDEGRIAGIGTHRELLEASKVYREIVYSQLSAEEIA